MDPAALLAFAIACAPAVHPDTTAALVRTESALNPHAIGVVGGALARQPRTLVEALTTARDLQQRGRNFSVGLAQINRHNFARLGLTLESAFEPCTNLAAMQQILAECAARADRGDGKQRVLRRALSCYYSGDFATGFRHGYVARVVALSASPTSR